MPSKSSSPNDSSDKIDEKLSTDDQCPPAISGAAPTAETSSMAEAPCLCPEQRSLLELILQGHNVFYTGGAGTGKSTVLRAAVAQLRDRRKHVSVITPTGISALNVGGSTYFTYAGWSPSILKKSLKDIKKMAMSKERRNRMKTTDVLIIDEISMLESNQFRRLDRACRAARRCGLPFGGMQVVVTGDFCQLPPVKPFQTCYTCGFELKTRNFCWTCHPTDSNTEESRLYEDSSSQHQSFCKACGLAFLWSLKCLICDESFDLDDQWAFRSDTWVACQFRCISLSQIHRQSEPAFIQLLNTLRIGERLNHEQLSLLPERDCSTKTAVELSPLRHHVHRKNLEGYQKLAGITRTYRCHDFAHIQPHHPELAAKFELDGADEPIGCQEHRFPSLSEHRLPAKLETKVGMPVILLANIAQEDGLVNGSQGHIVAYASHFMSVQDCDKHSAHSRRLTLHEKDQISSWKSHQGPDFQLPIVRFENGRQRMILPICQNTELGDPAPFSIIARTQIPLLPAWAITIHKSQGMTLSKAVINLEGSFQPQMAYVALSRVRSLDGVLMKNRSGLEPVTRGVHRGGGIAIVRQFMETCFGPQQVPVPSHPARPSNEPVLTECITSETGNTAHRTQ